MLTIQSRQEGDVTVLTLGGLLTAGRESTNLYKTIQQHVDDGNVQILLEFSDVSYIDSAGIGEVVSSFTLAKKSGGVLKLCGLQAVVQEVFRVTGLLGTLEIHDTEQGALESFQ